MTRDYSLGPRLSDDYRGPLAHVLGLGTSGTAVEFGVGGGYTLRMIAARMPVIGFDSFEGLPEDWRPGFEAGTFASTPPKVDNTELMIGLFADTLPGFSWPDDMTLVHIDCDLYSSTKTVLDHIGPALQPGTYIVFDEWHGYDGCQDHEQRAWREYAEAHPELDWAVIGHGPEQWAIRVVSS